jgi:hypothetical protein
VIGIGDPSESVVAPAQRGVVVRELPRADSHHIADTDLSLDGQQSLPAGDDRSRYWNLLDHEVGKAPCR